MSNKHTILLAAIDNRTIIFPILCLVAYIFGRIPFAIYIAKLKGIDLLKEGSKNPGASNVIRLAGWKYGIIAILLDAFKGFLPTLLALILLDYNHPKAIVVLICAVLGHSFPITRKGGKGVATTAGGMLALYPIVAIIAAIGWFVIMKIFKTPAIASLTCGLFFTVSIIFIEKSTIVKILIILSYLLLVVRHFGNILRLFKGNENQV